MPVARRSAGVRARPLAAPTRSRRFSARLRSLGILLAKLAVLAGLLWFAATRIDLGDRLTVAPAVASTSTLVRLPSPDGGIVVVAASDSLRLEGEGKDLMAVDADGRRAPVSMELLGPGGPLTVQPGLRSVVRSIRPTRWIYALLLVAPVPLVLAWRWSILAHAMGVTISFPSVVRLTWVGLFFNTFVPGGAGGDLVKAVQVGSHTDRHSAAIGSIIADRVVGLLVLVALGLTASASLLRTDSALFQTALATLALLVFGLLAYLSPTVRRWVRVEEWIARMPFGEQLLRLDEALVGLRQRPGALVRAATVSTILQLFGMVATLQLARGIGIWSVGFLDVVRVLPAAYAVNALPISPGGLGLLEVAFQEMLSRQGLASPSEGFALGALVRMLTIVWSLPGLGLWLLRSGRVA